MAHDFFRTAPTPLHVDDATRAGDRHAADAGTRFARLLDGTKTAAQARAATPGDEAAANTSGRTRAGAGGPDAGAGSTEDRRRHADTQTGAQTDARRLLSRERRDAPNASPANLPPFPAEGAADRPPVPASPAHAATVGDAGLARDARSWGATGAFPGLSNGAREDGDRATDPATPPGVHDARPSLGDTPGPTASPDASPLAARVLSARAVAWRAGGEPGVRRRANAAGEGRRGAPTSTFLGTPDHATPDHATLDHATLDPDDATPDHPLLSRLTSLVTTRYGGLASAGAVASTDTGHQADDSHRELSIRLDPALLPETVLTLAVSRADLSLRFASPLAASRALLSAQTDELASRLTKRTGRQVSIDITT
ncbi:hypothetical protein OVY01_07400 [Robbsia sp. Bb-Pol-6]|uniref:Flagellar hook-length control protein-like C-terminal domain-containing protein n=1 Tax=Robbsia betulipollinis TaxID=2981849 RepID=A0ABT3ZKL2_9BURK|nr:type III secretion HpaP family protein [Robbsia betulipollinis]MCY0387061.1 hypothetical protein [Robbsia betulipollinis]